MNHAHTRNPARPAAAKGLLLVAVVCLFPWHSAAAQRSASAGTPVPHLVFPAPLAPWQWENAAGVMLLTVPRDIVEEEINKAPSLDLQSALGLPWQFSAHARATIQYLTNHVQLGGRWSHAFGSFAFAAGYDVAFCFGFVDLDGFDNRMTAWLNYPYVSVGVAVDDVQLTLKGEALLVLYQRTHSGENELGIDRNRLTGVAVSFVSEQPFWRTTYALLGARIAVSTYHYQTWFSFSGFKRPLVFSELLFGIIL
jgi:hypothetical protein